MRADIEHLTAPRRAELNEVVRILFEEFEQALRGRKATSGSAGRILKVILYGSYARGDYVADPAGGYFSDFDLLVVVSHDELADPVEYWSLADERITRELAITHRLRTPVSFIVHSYDNLNAQLRRGRPFFRTIVREGVLLYDTPGYDLTAPARLSVHEAHAEAALHFQDWFPSAERFIRAGDFLAAEDGFKEALFQYHQATERLYHCTLLVMTLYSPKSHKLALLRSQAEAMAPLLTSAWPRASRFEQRSFELLKRAYVEARYSPHFKVSEDELAWVSARIRLLRDMVLNICDDRLRSSESNA
jgi:predicted nucleotidyltransferase